MDDQALETIDHAGMLEDLAEMPRYLAPGDDVHARAGSVSCSFCGIGDSGMSERVLEAPPAAVGGSADDAPETARRVTVFKEVIREGKPTTGCVKLRHSTMRQRVAYPIHTSPSVLDRATGKRRVISYEEAIGRFADLLLQHRGDAGRTLLYASGQVDYFAVFAIQEVFRLLGCLNLTGNAEHCLNSGATFAQILTGAPGPVLTIDLAVNGPNRFYLWNGWNGFIGHPPAFAAMTKRPDCDAFIVEVQVTETAKLVAKQLGKERVLLIRPRADPHLALSVAHQILVKHPEAVSARFVERFSAPGSFEAFSALARSEQFAPERVAARVAAEPEYAERIERGIELIAQKMAQPGMVPIHIGSMGLSQTSGVVAHCLWACVMAMVGKYGLHADGTLAGGTLRLPGQINAESEVQGLSRKYFMGRIPIADAREAAARMGLPEDAYDALSRVKPRPALDYSQPTPGERELFVCVGTQFEANMMGRQRWVAKLSSAETRLVVIDPIPDPFTLKHADLVIPSPPHPAAAKLYQNGEWKMTLSVPQKQRAPETRTDATILYDVMAEITQRLEAEESLAAAHPDLTRHVGSGYMRQRFCPTGLTRIDGEASRPELWARVLAYFAAGSGPLYCRPDHPDGTPIAWNDFLQRGSIYYGGVGKTRARLDYDSPDHVAFRDVYRRPSKFKFFTPTPEDLALPEGVILNSGRSQLSDDRERIAFATSTFNSGKATPIVNIPEDNPLFVSPTLAAKHGLKTGERARVTNRASGVSIELPVEVSDRVKGDTLYVSFHKSRAQMDREVYVNDVTSHEGRCPYSTQTNLKATAVTIERAEARIEPGTPRVANRRVDTTHIDPKVDLPIWNGQDTALHVTEILQETHDVSTFRFQGDPLCRFVYWPGQFCTFVLNIDGKKVVRSYSISSTPTRPYSLEVTVKRVPGGLVSNWLPDNLKVGDRVEIAGPKGKFCLVPGKVPPKILFLSAGSGITPLMAMSRWLCDVAAEVDVKFFNSVRSPDDIIFEKEIEMLTSRYSLFEPIHITSSRGGRKGWTGMTGRISPTMLEMVAPDFKERHIYICGPQGFMDAAKTIVAGMGFDMANYHAESFGGVRTSVADKPLPVPVGPPSARGTPVSSPEPAGAFTIEFARSGKTAHADGKLPLLDVAEGNDVDVGYSCRSGNCGECKVKLLRGEAVMSVDDGLDAADRAAGYVLSCVALPKTSCVVDA
jgi:ferredoxin-NADP reductase/anaerobic selenocysteine-containing dehydrogenase